MGNEAAVTAAMGHAKREGAPAPTGVTAEQKAKAEAVKQEVAKDALKANQEKGKAVDEARLENAHNKFIEGSDTTSTSGERKRTTGPRSEEARYLEAKAWADGVNKFLKGEMKFNDPNVLTGEEKVVIAQIRKGIESVNPAYKSVWEGLTDTDPELAKDIVELIRNDPQLSKKIQTALENATDVANAVSTADLLRLQKEMQAKDDAAKKKKNELAVSKAKAEAAARNANRYADGTVPGISKGDEYKVLEKINTDMPNIEARKQAAQQQVAALEAQIRGKEIEAVATKTEPDKAERARQKAEIDVQIATLREEARLAKEAVAKEEALLATKKRIEEERAAAEQARQEAQLAYDNAKVDADAVERDALHAKAEHGIAHGALEKAQQDYVNSIKSVLSRGAGEYAQEEFSRYAEAQKRLEEKKKGETKDANERRVQTIMSDRYNNKEKSAWRRELYNRTAIGEDWKDLVGNLGPEGAKQALDRLLAKDLTLSGTDRAKLMADKEFVDKMGPQVVQELITKRMMTTGIKSYEAEMILQTEWGKDMIGKAISKKADIKQQIENMQKDGTLSKDWVQKIKGKKALWLFALLFGAAVVVAPGVVKRIAP